MDTGQGLQHSSCPSTVYTRQVFMDRSYSSLVVLVDTRHYTGLHGQGLGYSSTVVLADRSSWTSIRRKKLLTEQQLIIGSENTLLELINTRKNSITEYFP